MNDTPRFYTLEPRAAIKRGQVTTAALRQCLICDHVVETMGGPGCGSLCVDCTALILAGRVKLTREEVLAALDNPDENP